MDGRPGTHHVDSCLSSFIIVGRPQSLAINHNHWTTSYPTDGLNPFKKTGLALLRINIGKDL